MSANGKNPEEKARHDAEVFFANLTDCFERFAEKHNMKVDKYWHEFPSWRFTFKHPKGGLACIEVMKEEKAEFKVYGYWWLDNYNKGTRSSRKYESKILQIERADMRDLLEDTLEKIISWPLDSWTEVGTGFGLHWAKTFTEEQFGRLSDTYPTLKV
jgi:hypothetical protein